MAVSNNWVAKFLEISSGSCRLVWASTPLVSSEIQKEHSQEAGLCHMPICKFISESKGMWYSDWPSLFVCLGMELDCKHVDWERVYDDEKEQFYNENERNRLGRQNSR